MLISLLNSLVESADSVPEGRGDRLAGHVTDLFATLIAEHAQSEVARPPSRQRAGSMHDEKVLSMPHVTTGSEPVVVAVRASDPLTQEAVTAYLQTQRHIRLSPCNAASQADMVVLIIRRVTEAQLALVYDDSPSLDKRGIPVVLVVDEIAYAQVKRAVNYGVVSVLLRHQTDLDRLMRVIVATHAGHAELPGVNLRSLIDELRITQENAAAGLGSVGGFSPREIDVLRMLADGLDTAEIAQKLSYSERTIKNIIHGIFQRAGLRNRAHAVAHAARVGIL
ncbi:helix-turn-helix transcriptional regulator [Streptomyces mirabilis]